MGSQDHVSSTRDEPSKVERDGDGRRSLGNLAADGHSSNEVPHRALLVRLPERRKRWNPPSPGRLRW